jgi:hypothetical protein
VTVRLSDCVTVCRRARNGFDFVAEGSFQKKGEMMRLKAAYGEDAFRKVSREGVWRGVCGR